MIALEQHELLPQAVLALAQGVDPTPHGGHTLTDGQVEPFDKGSIDLPATCRQHLLAHRHFW